MRSEAFRRGILAFVLVACFSVVCHGQQPATPALPDEPSAAKQKETIQSQPDLRLQNHPQVIPPTLPRELTATGKKNIVAPSFSSEGGAQCDENGAVYFHVITGGSNKNPTIFKLGRTEDEHQLYKLPPEVVDEKSAFYTAYSVTPAGRLWVLVVEWFGDEAKVAAYGFDSKAAVTSEVHMETPAHLRPRRFAAFDNDVFFVEGDISETLGSQKTSRPYAAIVDSAGTVMKELHPNLQGLQIQKGKLPEGAAIAGRDGNLYLLLPDQVVVISQSGQIIRRLPFPKSDREAIATGISLSGGLVAIQIMEQQKHTLGLTLVLLDANTGDQIGFYQPSQELGNNAICFSRTEGFTFLRVFPETPDGNLVLLTAALR